MAQHTGGTAWQPFYCSSYFLPFVTFHSIFNEKFYSDFELHAVTECYCLFSSQKIKLVVAATDYRLSVSNRQHRLSKTSQHYRSIKCGSDAYSLKIRFYLVFIKKR